MWVKLHPLYTSAVLLQLSTIDNQAVAHTQRRRRSRRAVLHADSARWAHAGSGPTRANHEAHYLTGKEIPLVMCPSIGRPFDRSPA